MKQIILFLSMILLSSTSYAQKHQLEKYYQNGFAKLIHGQTEVVLLDKTRADIVTDTFAIEVDFAHKWAESIGQSLHYANMLNKKAGILLIVDGKKDDRFIKELIPIVYKNNITLWVIDLNTDDWKKVKISIDYEY